MKTIVSACFSLRDHIGSVFECRSTNEVQFENLDANQDFPGVNVLSDFVSLLEIKLSMTSSCEIKSRCVF